MSNLYDKPLRFELSARRTYQVWLVMLYASASLSLVLFTSLMLPMKITLWFAVSVLLFWQWRKLILLPRIIIKQNEIDWLLEDQDGNVTAATLLEESCVFSWLIILHFKMTEGARRCVVILPYMLDKNSYRQLSVYLRMTNLNTLTDE